MQMRSHRGVFRVVVVLAAMSALAFPAAAQRCTPVQVDAPTNVTGDAFGGSVAVWGDTMIVGAPVEELIGGTGLGHAYVYRWTGTGWALEATLSATGTLTTNNFGCSVALYDDTALVGAYRDGDGGAAADQASAFIFVRHGTTWTLEAELNSPDGRFDEWFGFSVALYGTTAVVGAPYHVVPGTGAIQGAAFVFERTSTGWMQQAQWLATDGVSNDRFGSSISLNGDTAVVGAVFKTVGVVQGRGAAYVFTRSGTAWTQQAKLLSPDGDPVILFGTSVAVLGDTAMVSAPNQNVVYSFERIGTTWGLAQFFPPGPPAFGWSIALAGNTALMGAPSMTVGSITRQGGVFVFGRSGPGGVWTLQTTITAPDGVADDSLGSAVALFGDTAVAGASGHQFGGNGARSSAWVFSRTGSTWIGPDLRALPAGGAAGDELGYSVAISGDTALVGAYHDDVGTNADQGSAYVFVRSTSGWTLQAQLISSDGAAGDGFGNSVAIDGDRALVGASGHDVGGNLNQGAVYVFERFPSGAWSQTAILTATGGLTADQFGKSVALSGDTALVGAYLDDVGTNGSQGSAYVFTRSGMVWAQQAQLLASDGAANDNFGVAVSLEGNTALVGAYRDDIGAATDRGSAYVFTRSGTVWSQQAKLTASDGALEDEFGFSVGLSGDTAVVGAHFDDIGSAANRGSAYVFTRAGTVWTQKAQLTASDGIANDHFGEAVAVSGDTVVVGADLDDVGTNAAQGSVYVYTRMGTIWSQAAHLTASNGLAVDEFGTAVAISGGTIVVGANLYDEGVNASQGAAYTFDVAFDCLAAAHNDTLNTSFASLSAAFAGAVSGHLLTGTPEAFAQVTTLDTLGRTLGVASTGPVRTPRGSTMIFDSASSLAAAAGKPVEVFGVMRVVGAGAVVQVTATNFLIGPQAELTAQTGDTLAVIGGNYDCAIDANARYNLALATLRMEGPGGERTLEVMSTDQGRVPTGLDPTQPGHYPIGTLRVGPSPATVRLVDAHDNDLIGQGSCEALYVGTLQIDAGSRLINTNCRIYYNTLVNNGTVDVAANLFQICRADFNSSGTVTVADIFAFLSAWFATLPSADFNGSGAVNVADIFAFLSAWFAGC